MSTTHVKTDQRVLLSGSPRGAFGGPGGGFDVFLWSMRLVHVFEFGIACFNLCMSQEGASFEGVWAEHTTVIRAADLREVGNLVRIRASKIAGVTNFAEMLRFPRLLSAYVFRCKVFHQKFEKTCSHCSGATCVR